MEEKFIGIPIEGMIEFKTWVFNGRISSEGKDGIVFKVMETYKIKEEWMKQTEKS